MPYGIDLKPYSTRSTRGRSSSKVADREGGFFIALQNWGHFEITWNWAWKQENKPNRKEIDRSIGFAGR